MQVVGCGLSHVGLSLSDNFSDTKFRMFTSKGNRVFSAIDKCARCNGGIYFSQWALMSCDEEAAEFSKTWEILVTCKRRRHVVRNYGNLTSERATS